MQYEKHEAGDPLEVVDTNQQSEVEDYICRFWL